MVEHLTVVSDDHQAGDGGGGDPKTPRDRQPARPRPKKTLPTERLKIDKQAAALQAFARASERGAYGVGAKQIAPRIGVSEDTAALVNNFFVAAGFITKAGKGKYKPVPEVVAYERAVSLNTDGATAHLANLLAKTWYFTSVQPELAGGRAVAPDVLVSILAEAAGVGGERKDQLAMVIEWLKYVDLVTEDDGKIKLGGEIETAGATESTTPENDTPQHTATPLDSDTKSTGATTHRGDAPTVAATVLAFKFEFSLTADDQGGGRDRLS